MKGLLLFVNINFILFFLFQSTFAQTNQTVTNGSATSSINFPGAGCIYNWVNDTPGIGLAASGTGNIASFTAVNTGAVPVTAIITGLPINMGPACNGTLITFSITVNPSVAATITASNATGTISACAGTASASPNIQQFTVTGSGLTGNITATAPTGFEVSLSSASGYGSSVILTKAGDSVSSTIVYVRSAATVPAGSISENVVLSSTGATSQNVAVTGTANALLTVNPVSNQTVNNGASTTAINFTGTANAFTWVNDTPGIGLAASGSGNIPSFTAVNTGSGPVKATITATPLVSAGYAYINNVDDNNVSVINTTSNAVMATIPVGTQPIGIAVTPDGSRVYITNSGSNNVSVISTQTNTVIATIAVGAYPYSAAISPDGSLAYIANLNGGSISIINTTTNTVKATVQVGTYAYYIAQNADGSRLYISDMTDSFVYVFDVATNTVINTIKTPYQPYGLCVSNDGTKVYVANYNSNNISVISTASNAVIASILTDRQPEAIVESPDGKWLYVANGNSTDVTVIDVSTNLPTVNIQVGEDPQSLSLTADGRYLYVVNSGVGSRNVSVIDTKTNTVIAEVPVGNAPISFGNFIKNNSGCPGQPVIFTITVNPTISSPPTISEYGGYSELTTVYGTPSAVDSFYVSGKNLTDGILVTRPPNGAFEVSTDNVHFSSSVLAGGPGNILPLTIYIRLAATTPVGTYNDNKILLTSAGAADFAFNLTTGIVAPASLNITADKKTKIFRQPNPVLTVTYAGFVNNDNLAALTVLPAITTTAILGSPAGQYPITVSGAQSPNYTFTYVPGVLIVIADTLSITIPNTFTPNGDGINDTWNIKYLNSYPNCTVGIYNRYGEKLYSSIGYGEPWDGRYKGAMLPQGTYYYIIDLKNGLKVLSGSVTIIR